MNKIAFFVEGRSEQIFASKLIEAIAAKNSTVICWKRILGGTTIPRRVDTLRTSNQSTNAEHYFLIFDCKGDSAVKSRMLEEYDFLAKNGYKRIICIRDVYPEFIHSEIPKLEAGLPLYVRTKPIVVKFILQVMEIEAWFLSEHTHFERISNEITIDKIKIQHGFDPSSEDMSQRPKPSADLDDCYKIGSKSYTKDNVDTTIDAVDTTRVILEVAPKNKYLELLCSEIEEFLTATE